MSLVGTPKHLTATFADASGAPVDPTTVTLNLIDPAGTVTTFTAVKDVSGSYHYDYTPAMVGQYQWWFSGSGSNAAAPDYVDTFIIRAATSGALVSLAAAKRQLNKTSTTDDDEIMGYILAASDIINARCGYTAPTVFTETVQGKQEPAAYVAQNGSYDAIALGTVVVNHLPVLTVTSVAPVASGITGPDLTTLQPNYAASGILKFTDWGANLAPVTVTYTAGRATVPPVLQTACLILVEWLWDTQRGSGTMPGMGGEDPSTDPATVGIPARALQLMEMSTYTAIPGIA